MLSLKGLLYHDHWKPCYQYECTHALCNAHRLRELERAWEQDHQQWAKAMQALLGDIATAIEDAGGRLLPNEAEEWRRRNRQLLEKAEIECPPPDESQQPGRKRSAHGEGTAEDLRLLPVHAGSQDLLSCAQLPFNLSQVGYDGHSSIDIAISVQKSRFHAK